MKGPSSKFKVFSAAAMGKESIEAGNKSKFNTHL